MYLTSLDGTIHKLSDDNGNGIWGEPGELNVAIVTGNSPGRPQHRSAPDRRQHALRRDRPAHDQRAPGGLDQRDARRLRRQGLLQRGDRPDLGRFGLQRDHRLDPGPDHSRQPDRVGQRLHDRAPGLLAGADPARLRALHERRARASWSSTPPGRGTRSACAWTATGNLWFTNNFNRTATLGNGQAGFGLRGDQLDSDFSRDVQDQLFRAVPGADYGYTDVNWRGVNPMLTPRRAGYQSRDRRSPSTTSSTRAPTPCTTRPIPTASGRAARPTAARFWYSSGLPAELQGNIFIVRYNGTITEAPAASNAR